MGIISTLFALETWKPKVKHIYANEITKAIAEGHEGLYFIEHDNNRLYVYKGNRELDKDYCDLNHMTVYDLEYSGGPLIGSALDLSFGFVLPEDSINVNKYILATLVEILKEYGLDAHWMGNDLMVDNKKVGGSFIQKVGNRYVWCMQISFRDYSKHIKILCTKPTIKRPSYINPRMLSREQLKAEIIKAFT
jgi:lipoate-protein ligase A